MLKQVQHDKGVGVRYDRGVDVKHDRGVCYDRGIVRHDRGVSSRIYFGILPVEKRNFKLVSCCPNRGIFLRC